MNVLFLYTQLIATALCTAIACSIPGTFLILRGTSLISDAIGHAIFLGIVISFLLFKQLYTPILFTGAAIMALITIWAIEKLIATKRLHADAVIGIVFPFLFSIAVILINLYAQNIHLDIDAVLLGELAFSPFYQIIYNGQMLGSYGLWTMLGILICNILLLIMYYKKLQLSTFDADFATNIGYNSHRIYWLLMSMTTITILGAFEVVGAILIVAFIITPPATAYLLTNKLPQMIALSCALACLGTLIGCLSAQYFNISIAGSIATSYSILFTSVYFIKQFIK